jgi:hypothetical protein
VLWGSWTYTESQILHHVAHTAQSCHGILSALSAPCQQVLYTAIWINLHGAQVVEPVDQPRILAELLVESIRQVVRRVGRDEEDGFAVLGELDGEGA